MHSSPAAFQVAFEEDKTPKPAFPEEHRHLPRPPFPPAKHESSAGGGHAPRCTSRWPRQHEAGGQEQPGGSGQWAAVGSCAVASSQGPTEPLSGDGGRAEQPSALHQAGFREKKACPQISNRTCSQKKSKTPAIKVAAGWPAAIWSVLPLARHQAPEGTRDTAPHRDPQTPVPNEKHR